MSEEIPRSFFEVNETRSFLAEALRLIDNEHNVKPVGAKEKLTAYAGLKDRHGNPVDLDLNRERAGGEGEVVKEQPIQFCDEARFNLVRVDYLKPSMLRPLAYRAAKASTKLKKSSGFFGLLETHLGFSDLTPAVGLLPFPARMRRFRLLAFLLGVLPEIATLTMIVVAGIPYILWSGYKVDSDTQGMEEIILATLAIVFIYDIDDSVYEHVLPELYKEAHERDRFELSRGWISSETARNLAAITAVGPPVAHMGGGAAAAVAGEDKQEAQTKRDAGKGKQGPGKQVEKRVRRLTKSHPLVWVVKRELEQLRAPPAALTPGASAESAADLVVLGRPKSFVVPPGGVGELLSLANLKERKGKVEDADVEMGMTETTAERAGSESPSVPPGGGAAPSVSESEKERARQELEQGMGLLIDQFDRAMADLPMTADRALAMSASDHWNDLYLARAYPFLYARKLRYALAGHAWERFLVAYGANGLHYLVLVGLTVVIVGGYRSLARCERFAPPGSSFGIFGAQPWPSTCLLGVGPTADRFSLLNGSSADGFMAVSCGVGGYIPGAEEWQRNKDFLTKEERR